MLLSNRDIVELTEWRRKLHQRPEISGEEEKTAAEVSAFLAATKPDRLMTGLGGHGLAAFYESGRPGPTLMFRCELDALPIVECTEAPHRSQISGKGHLCGHDGHMAILAGVARGLACRRPESGRVVLLFQPAEETGAGAAAILADPRFAEIAPDFAFALHNFPGLLLGHVALKEGAAACASRGMKITLTGRTAHASQPETGISPMPAVARLMPALTALAAGGTLSEDFSLVTITHAAMGEPAFGIAPGEAEIFATLRTLEDARMEALVARAEDVIAETAGAFGLSFDIVYEDVFFASDNDPDAVAHLRQALDHERIFHSPGEPMRASEDFGRFGASAKSALLFLGAGETHPPLHDPEYDFPDDLIAIGARIFLRTAYDILG
ncbi:amidohydrolase [Rhodopseudomonas julia]|uniref:Amidohydrolase n=1 Tax=Rhodopseudomonas julia TaxID=200617 RepID=A0ABU0C483_9BRAD|nr:amidohydrolase [Rhodopseudomonas julia]MDQ0324485.1 amidohydrolase [Rhodopseudomonas julia]